ncbi:hypothetical protein [uncultured Sulfitobacter sp.]|uniref:hypothetical protein n=1 Tax=uncultured Sulfitobacter sp. TaxID=191468 RepID=UPI00260C812D|nr:hypothetical protein [uncultured Sulfitobacter sp.]
MRYMILTALMVATACAKQPENIPAADIGPNPYLRFSCKNLAQEKLNLSQSLENLSAAQKSAASGDTVGVLLLGLPVSSMSGNDKETAIAVTKGRIQAAEVVQQQKGCA